MKRKLMNILIAATVASGLFTCPVVAEDGQSFENVTNEVVEESLSEETVVDDLEGVEETTENAVKDEMVEADGEAETLIREEAPVKEEQETPLLEQTEDPAEPEYEEPVFAETNPDNEVSAETVNEESSLSPLETPMGNSSVSFETAQADIEEIVENEEVMDADEEPEEELTPDEEEALMAMAMEAQTYADSALINVNVSMLSGLTVTSNPIVDCDENGKVLEDTAYTGTIEGNWNLIGLLEPAYNEYLKQESFASPRTIFNKDSAQPSIQYTITVPADQDVRLTNVATTDNSAGLFAKIYSSISADGKSCVLTLDLPWWNYGQYFTKYLNVKANNPDASVLLSLSYEGNAKQGQDSASAQNAIRNEGFGSFWYYKNSFFGKISTEVMRFTTSDGTNGKPLYSTRLAAPSTVEVTFKVENGTWADGSLEPKLVDVALTNGVGHLLTTQIPTGMVASEGYTGGAWEVEPNDATDITGATTYIYRFEEMQKVEGTLNVKGDILIDGDTENQNVIVLADTDNEITFTGSLDLSEVLRQLEEIEAQYRNNMNGQDIALKNIKTEFKASLTLPSELDFVDGNATAELVGANGKFEISATETAGRTVTVTMKPTESLTDFAMLKDTLNAVNKTLVVHVGKAKANATALRETSYTAVGTFDGFFNATAVNPISGKEMRFDMKYNGVQSDEGRDVLYPNEAERLSISFSYKKEPSLVEVTSDIGGDIRVGNDTEHDAVYTLSSLNDEIRFTGVLDFSSVKKQMEVIEQQYANVAGDQIQLSDVKGEFFAELTIPNELNYVSQPKAVLEGANHVFDCETYNVNGNTVTLRLWLAEDCSDYAQLKEALSRVNDELTLTMNAAIANDQAETGKVYTTEGSFKGTFTAKATNRISAQEVNFKLHYNGKQIPEGSDFLYPDDEQIRFSFQYPDILEVNATTEVEGDLLVNDDAEHDQIYETTLLNGPLVFTGTLNLKNVLEQLEAIEAQYGQNVIADQIGIRNLKSEYTATLTLPDELDFVSPVQAVLSGDQGGFEIKKVEQVDTKTVKITMTPSGNIESFAQLKKILTDANETLKVTLSDVVPNDTMAFGTNYTVVGTFNGYLRADATNLISGKIIRFNLNYVGKQSADGADFIDANNLDRITCTVKYTQPSSLRILSEIHADILVNNNTQHDKVYEVGSKNDALTFVGILSLEKVREEMVLLEKQLAADGADDVVELRNMNTEFTATLTLPEALDHNSVPKAEVTGHNGGLVVSEARVDGKTVTVVMKTAPSITTLRKLREVVDCADENLVITLSNVKANNKMVYDANHTVVGMFNGYFNADAVNTKTNEQTFVDLQWVGKQIAHGADSTQPFNLDNVSCTVTFRKPATVPTPNPTKPNPPQRKPVPNTADTSGMELYTMFLMSSLTIAAIAMAVLKKQKYLG